MERPSVNEYDDYFKRYVELVPDGNIFSLLKEQINETKRLLSSLSEEQLHYRYMDNKWSIKEIIGHLTDGERMLSHLLLCIARGENSSYAGFDKDKYIMNGSFDNLSIELLLAHYQAVRTSTIALLNTLGSNVWLNQGIALHSPITVRALAWIIVGHEIHHRNIIIEKYINKEI
ncbi:DinB family protein [Metabacillus malikii]|uniref:Damage-inducible protein DinB n=1 Tax=Metabacillus malikii TaxID=1504265 RepID=A0ABT9ZAS6_9BACI|nr:DinB family protein [Metabacillus malikii]MDQ0229322.1 putative damage-inducible protein DinB [Metabacillus malikii]